jgi:hypothetical protein
LLLAAFFLWISEDLRVLWFLIMASPAASSTSQAGGSGSKKAEAIDDLLQRLGIEEDEFDDLVFEEQESAPKEGMKWTALARIHTTNFFSPQTFEQHMRIAWSPAKEVKFQHLEENLFSIQCFCLGDWIKVEKGGPWLFRQNPVCIEKYDGLAPIESVDLNFFATWIQIHRLPIGYRNDTLVKNLTERNVGKVLEVQMNVQGMGNFVRARVKLDVRKVLARFVTISRDVKREFYQVKYEKMPRYCGACGFVGHSHLECGTREHDENNLKWGDFLQADWSSWHGRGIGGNRGGGRGGRGGRSDQDGNGEGRGRGTNGARGRGGMASWRYNALPYVDGVVAAEDPLDDTGSSPVKKPDEEMEENGSSDSTVKRRLEMNQQDEDELLGQNKEDLGAAMVVDTGCPAIADPGKVDKTRTKRSKKDGAISPSNGSAGSFEESVRSQ